MRRAVEVAFELTNGGEESLGRWLLRSRQSGMSLRMIADQLEHRTSIRVSHETVRQWMIEG